MAGTQEPTAPTPVAQASAEATGANVSDANQPGASSTPEPGAKPVTEASPVTVKDAKPKSIDITRKVVADMALDSSTGAKGPNAVVTPGVQAPAVADKDLPFHAHPRWQEVQTEVKTLRQQNTELTAQAAQFKDGAERHQALTDFMGQTGLEGTEVSELLKFGAMAKSQDPVVQKQCAETLLAIGHQLLEGLGELLPADLQAKVDAGLLDEASAKETARLRGEAGRATQQAEKSAETLQAEQQSRSQREVMTSIVNWENETRGKDLRYTDDMSKLVADKCAALIQQDGGKLPKTAPAARKLMDRAYKEVTETLGRVAPPKTPKEVNPSRSVASAGSSAALSRKGMKSIDITRAIMAGQQISD